MTRRRHLGLWLAFMGLLIVATPGLAQTAKAKAKAKMKRGGAVDKKVDPAELASGVIVKVSPVTTVDTKAAGNRSVALTINTAAVWRDWARDQSSTDTDAKATDTDAKSPRKAAQDGKNSVATEGQPTSPDTVVVVEVKSDVKIETRYRSVTDEISDGAKTPAGAAKAEANLDASEPKTPANDKAAGGPAAKKAQSYTLDDLKTGLFVEIEWRRVKGKESASLVRVLRPVGAQGIPAGTEPKK